jgi:hypothetical protein
MGRLFRLADGCGFIYVWFYEVVPRQRDPQEEIYKERRAGESQTAPCAKANWVLNLSAARRQVSPSGVKDAESGDKLRSLRRPFHPDVQFLSISK